jgi:putative nucleotidyltransferase with HDIG domain
VNTKSGNSKAEILIAEDSPTQVEQLKYLLEKHGYQVSVANNGRYALALLQERKPTIIISDIIMPEMDGYELCRQVKANEKFKSIPVILLTALSNPEDVIRGLECGADNFITKPYDEKYLISRINYLLANIHLQDIDESQVGLTIHFGKQKYFISSNRLQIFNLLLSTYETAIQKNRELERVQEELRKLNEQLEDKVKEKTGELEEALKKLRKSMDGIIQAVAMTVESRDPYTAGHQKRVANLAYIIASEMRLQEDKLEGTRMAGTIHDLGKVSVPSEILSKPNSLNEIEFSLIKDHVVVGYNILKDIDFPWPLAQVVFQHHERIDGSGYPQGLRDEGILVEAKILAVADVVEAMSSHRPYRPALGIGRALDEISKNSGILYDPDVADACLKVFTEKGFEFENKY